MKLRHYLNLLFPNKIVLRRFSKGVGDNLMLSFLAREIKRSFPRKRVVVETERPELFTHNPNIDIILKGKTLPFYSKPKYHIDSNTTEHVLDQLIKQIPLKLNNWDRKLDLFLSPQEEVRFQEELPSDYIVVCPVGKRSFSSNRKEWGFNRFQKLVELLHGIAVVQIGLPADPLLEGVLDFRGTEGSLITLRECAAIIQNSLTGVFLEGGFMHLANAVDKPSVIIFGGALKPEITGYPNNVNIGSSPHCSPCFTSDRPMDTCDTMICMKKIDPETVAEHVRGAVKRALDRSMR